MRKKEQKVKNLEVLGQALIDFVDCSKDKIDHHLKDIRNRWQDLNNGKQLLLGVTYIHTHMHTCMHAHVHVCVRYHVAICIYMHICM